MGIEVKVAPDGTRYVRPYLGTDPVTGRKIRPYLRLPDGASDAECGAIVSDWLRGRGEAAGLSSSMRVGDLAAGYVRALEGQEYPANTIRTYRLYSTYLGRLADRDADDVTSKDLSRLYASLLGRRGLSPQTVRGLHAFLSGLWSWLVKTGVCETSPTDHAWVPRPAAHEALALSPDQLSVVAHAIDEARSSDRPAQRTYATAAYVALNAGLRVGEACGLRRRDLLDGGSLRVCGTVVEAGGPPRRQPKTKGRRSRTVALAPDVAEALAAYDGLSERELGHGGCDSPLLRDGSGGWPRPSSASRWFSRLRDGLGLPEGVTFHTLRHTHATTLLMAGVDAKTVSERLGHSDVSMTLRIYGHVLPGRDEEAAMVFDQRRDQA